MIDWLLYFIAVVVAFALAWYAVDALVTSTTVKKLATVVLVLVAGICVVYLLLGMAHGGPTLPPLTRHR